MKTRGFTEGNWLPSWPSKTWSENFASRNRVANFAKRSWSYVPSKDGFNIYHLIMTLPVCHGKIHHAIKNGKPSISIRAIEKPWRTVNVITIWYLFFGDGYQSIESTMGWWPQIIYPAWLCQNSYGIDGPFILDFPMKKCDFHSFLYVYQRVTSFGHGHMVNQLLGCNVYVDAVWHRDIRLDFWPSYILRQMTYTTGVDGVRWSKMK